jgi:hypothetical protein
MLFYNPEENEKKKRKFTLFYHFPLWLLAVVHSLFLHSFFNENCQQGRINFNVAFEGKILKIKRESFAEIFPKLVKF